MAKYIFTNWETIPFKRKSFEGQHERFAKVCVSSLDNPQQILAVIPIFRNTHIINIVHEYELGRGELPPFMKEPQEGEFVNVQSMHGPLFRRFSPDEAKYGICDSDKIWKAERDLTGKVNIYNSIQVFCLYIIKPILGKQYINGWFPNQLYYHYFGYNYLPLSDLTEPLRL